jgi:hypothetical protein
MQCQYVQLKATFLHLLGGIGVGKWQNFDCKTEAEVVKQNVSKVP